MLVYLPLRRLSEWRALTKSQRVFVWKQCVHALLTRWPSLLVKSCLSLCVLVLAWSFGWFDTMTGFVSVWAVGVMIIPDFVDMLIVARFYAQIRDYIQAHASEIHGMP